MSHSAALLTTNPYLGEEVINKADLTKVAVRFAGRSGLVLKQHSPAILTVGGIAGMVAAGVIAVKQTHDHLDEVLAEFDSNKSIVKEQHEKGNLDESTYKKAMVGAHLRHVGNLTKVYGPSISLAAAGIVSICVGHNILHKRNIALAAAYKGLEQSFSEYRKRVVEEFGEDKDKEFKLGLREEDQTDPETGETKRVVTSNPNTRSLYARVFDQHNKNWVPSAMHNRIFLKNQEQYCNDLLVSRGHLFLNDVYDALGMERTKPGSVVGWVVGRHGQKDGYVDFNLYDPKNALFLNGDENACLLDFNVDGVVYDKLDD